MSFSLSIQQDFRNALENNPRVRAFLGFPLHFEPGSVWHAAFEAVFQCCECSPVIHAFLPTFL